MSSASVSTWNDQQNAHVSGVSQCQKAIIKNVCPPSEMARAVASRQIRCFAKLRGASCVASHFGPCVVPQVPIPHAASTFLHFLRGAHVSSLRSGIWQEVRLASLFIPVDPVIHRSFSAHTINSRTRPITNTHSLYHLSGRLLTVVYRTFSTQLNETKQCLEAVVATRRMRARSRRLCSPRMLLREVAAV